MPFLRSSFTRLLLVVLIASFSVGSPGAAHLTAAAPTLQSISASGSVTGGGDITIKVSLTATATAATTISLKSNRPSVIPAPATIVIAKGARDGTVSVTTRSSNQQAEVTLTARLGSLSRTKVVTVKPPALSSVSLPESVEAGKAINITVRLNSKAPSGGMQVGLSSTNSVRLPVPATVKVPGGSTGVAVRVTVSAGADAAVTVTGQMNGISKSDSISVITNVRTYDFSFSEYPVPNVGAFTLTLTLNKTLPTNVAWGVYSFNKTWQPSNGCFGGLLNATMNLSDQDGTSLTFSRSVEVGDGVYAPDAGDGYVIALCSHPHGSSFDRNLVYYETFGIYDAAGGATESGEAPVPAASPVANP